ncbi:MAG: 2-C-methyl-D-erythritol 4-phosphate cytidylyltransferase [Bacteroidales bacterium]|nr:2-C-methyl-D-erythritol 4-phosphate cytidylyltransferase [Bacteroidales bacterium]
MMKQQNIAVILAGGSGQRFGSALPKQFLPLAGKTVIEYSVGAFEKCDAIDEIAVVMHPDYLPQMQAIIDRNGWQKVRKLLPGGAERYLSTLAALNAYEGRSDLNLIFHDAARPAVSQRIINETVTALQTHPAVAVAIPATDTVFEVTDDGNFITAIPARKRLRCAQTPQAFHIDIIREAYRKALKDKDFTSTDDCGVLLRYCPEVPIFIVPGDVSNMKLTYPSDTTLLEKTLTL